MALRVVYGQGASGIEAPKDVLLSQYIAEHRSLCTQDVRLALEQSVVEFLAQYRIMRSEGVPFERQNEFIREKFRFPFVFALKYLRKTEAENGARGVVNTEGADFQFIHPAEIFVRNSKIHPVQFMNKRREDADRLIGIARQMYALKNTRDTDPPLEVLINATHPALDALAENWLKSDAEKSGIDTRDPRFGKTNIEILATKIVDDFEHMSKILDEYAVRFVSEHLETLAPSAFLKKLRQISQAQNPGQKGQGDPSGSTIYTLF
jgi:hypothetical protein